MHAHLLPRALFVGGAALIAAVAVSLGTLPLHAAPPPAPATQPAAWIASIGKEVLRLKAEGVQIYTAEPDASGKLGWKFKAPEAVMKDEKGEKAGTHYAGPTWEHADGSKVVCVKVAERPSPNASSVPELQLKAKSHAGTGVMTAVIFVERLNTKGGKAPAITPDAKPGDELRVPYTAEYVFYNANP